MDITVKKIDCKDYGTAKCTARQLTGHDPECKVCYRKQIEQRLDNLTHSSQTQPRTT
jgi:hypothetical protein